MKAKPYPMVYVKFYDHCEGNKEDIDEKPVEILGVLWKESAKFFYIQPWVFSRNLSHEQNKHFAIVKGAVIEIKNLRFARVSQKDLLADFRRIHERK